MIRFEDGRAVGDDVLWAEGRLEFAQQVEGRDAFIGVPDCECEAVLAGAARGVRERVISYARDVGFLPVIGEDGIDRLARNEGFDV